ncbi:unnamed protein product [Orchesella dallaii]|uniref:Cilia- and flagella-associated protein 36 n=1 Tax=Orchesella dallaii TaxID=48710 RepID=A0ABP1R0N2_9HEXA
MSESDIQPAENADNWVFDSLVNFLHGSIWKVPVVGFIEEKSVVFDPDSYNNMTEEKEEEFRKIHDEYKGLVDFMLSSFMEDLQVTPEQVEDACRVREHQSKSLPESHITKVALEQLWAAEDFTSFRRLMTRKNIDLQLQSLELLVAKYGVLSPSLRSGDSEETAEDGEDDFLQVVISQLIQLEEAEAAMDEESNMKSTPAEATGTDEEKPKEETPSRQIPDQERLDEQTAVQIASTAPEQRRLLTAVRKALETNQDDSEPAASIDIPTGEKDEDIQKRREYLRAQRDKLVAMKKQEREKLLEKNEGQHSARPKSARAAQMAIKNPTNMRALSISEKSLSARRALADRLKQELIEK